MTTEKLVWINEIEPAYRSGRHEDHVKYWHAPIAIGEYMRDSIPINRDKL
ncbi:hypothetical protein ADIS_3054 [Lunatimonas lonarensis]|uniref:Uncharacterized protein n=1 Tax=Lunatimonas lonarensis TaxID=1232681 RepID=R7ZRJ9_9BACT|nr:hypothetical protein ADIS_3054 [Lunatimonas lonarensis]